MPPRLFGPLPLTASRINDHLRRSAPGVYALGKKRDGIFWIEKIGRSDTDLTSALRNHLSGPHKHFVFGYAFSARDAFEKECELYHSIAVVDVVSRYAGLHPTAPNCRCHYCGMG